MNLRFIPLALALLSSAFAATPAEEQSYPEHLLRVEARGGIEHAVLKMPLASYVDDEGRQVDLIGAVHVADASYYRHLNKIFRNYDKVLYEMVDGEGLSEMLYLSKKVEEGTASEEEYRKMRKLRRQLLENQDDQSLASQLLAYYYVKIALEHGLMLQSEGIDYGFENFVYADMSSEEFDAAMAARGESWLKMTLISFAEGFELEDFIPSFSNSMVAKRSNFIRSVSRGCTGSPMENMAIVIDRNIRCFEVLDQQLLDPANRKLGIFYGCMHLRDMDMRLRMRGFRLQKVEWIPAIRAVKPVRVKKD